MFAQTSLEVLCRQVLLRTCEERLFLFGDARPIRFLRMLGNLDPYVERVIFGEGPYKFFHNQVSFRGKAPFCRKEMALFFSHLTFYHDDNRGEWEAVLQQHLEQAFKDPQMLFHFTSFELISKKVPLTWCQYGAQGMYQLETLDLSKSTTHNFHFLKDLSRLKRLYLPNTDPAYTHVSLEALKSLTQLTHLYVGKISSEHIDGMRLWVNWNTSSAVQSFLEQLPNKGALLTLQLLQKPKKEFKTCSLLPLKAYTSLTSLALGAPIRKKDLPHLNALHNLKELRLMDGRTSYLKDVRLEKIKALEVQHPAFPLEAFVHMTGLRCLSLQGPYVIGCGRYYKKQTGDWDEKYDTSRLALLPCLRALSLGVPCFQLEEERPMLVKTDQDIMRLKEMKLDHLIFEKWFRGAFKEKIRQAGLVYTNEAIPLSLWEEIMADDRG